MWKPVNIINLFITLQIITLWINLIDARSISKKSRVSYDPRNVTTKAIDIIESYMDLSKDPCEDFFSYACGKWSDYHTNGRYTESTGLIDHKVNKRFLNLFKDYIDGEDSIIDKVMLYYKSCRHERKGNKIRYLRLAKPIIGLNWPLFEKLKENTSRWPKEKFNWLLAVANLRNYGLNNVFLDEVVGQNINNSTHTIIDLNIPHPHNANRVLPLTFIVATRLVEYGLPHSEAYEIAVKLESFEEEFFELLDIEDDIILLSVSEIENDIPQLPWRKYFKTLLGQQLNDDYIIQVRNLAYIKKLTELLEKTDPELICYYLMYHFLEFLNYDRSSTSDKIGCMVDVRSKMDLAMNFIYAERFYKEDAAANYEDVFQIFKKLRNELQKKLKLNRLGLKESEVEFLQQKLQTLNMTIGNLPKNVNQQLVKDYYKDIELKPNDYHHNHLELLKLKSQKYHEVILKGRPSSEEYFFIADSDTARSSTPFFLGQKNLIIVPYGFLQTPIYHRNMLNVLKYSLFGFNIAHELAHGFDASGILFDETGFIDTIGPDIANNKNVIDSLICMEHEETTNIDERVADIVGLRVAFDAYFTDRMSINEKMSGLGNQKSLQEIFFLNFAQFFCGNMASEFIDHDSDNIRLQQALSNFEPFSQIYKCRDRSTMNPSTKCRLY